MSFVLGATSNQIFRQSIARCQVRSLRRHLLLSRHRIQRFVHVWPNQKDWRSEYVPETDSRFGRMEHQIHRNGLHLDHRFCWRQRYSLGSVALLRRIGARWYAENQYDTERGKIFYKIPLVLGLGNFVAAWDLITWYDRYVVFQVTKLGGVKVLGLSMGTCFTLLIAQNDTPEQKAKLEALKEYKP